eukprot:gb/GFBE01050792.1/.p1 GENE.gb/GFBE01050792.1/~~gb/GFBE01050792.1/.p1  ORF type:complete len:800 (+),score=173.92 gb/GFBE01050792.1/:1-2400(+)
MGAGASSEAAKQTEKVKRKKERAEQKRKLREDMIKSQEQNADYQQKMRFLFQVPLLKRLPRDMQPLVAVACRKANYQPGTQIIKQGDIGDEFFVIQSGEASVKVTMPDGDTKVVARLGAGDYFGEKALLASEPRSATITAEIFTETLRIHRKAFDDLGLSEKLTFANRVANKDKQKMRHLHPPTPKTEEDLHFLRDAITSNVNLTAFGPIPEKKLQRLIDAMWKENVMQSKRIIREGDIGAESFYVVESGKFEVIVTEMLGDPKVPHQMVAGKKRSMDVLSRGDSFGELALLYLVPRKASIVCTEAAVVWVLDRHQFKDIMMPISEDKHAEYVKYFDAVTMFAPLLATERSDMAACLVEIHFSQNEFVIRQNERGATFFMLVDGEVTVHKDGKQIVKLLADPAKGVIPYFGERALLNLEKRQASVIVSSQTARCLMLDKDAFDANLGPLRDIIERSMIPHGDQATVKKQHHPGDPAREKIYQKDLQNCGRLGSGGFSRVDLVQHRSTGDTYALKSLHKGYILRAGMESAVANEKDILYMTSSPFIIRLYETYNKMENLYFLLEVALGGDLYTVYKKRNLFGNVDAVRFHIAAAMYGLEHMHERLIIYRDMKPENLLLDEHGNVKITDMGSAKFAMDKTFTVAGTPDYFSPEMCRATGHHIPTDWWAVGVVLFELMTSRTPFEAALPLQTYVKIEKGMDRVKFPPTVMGPCEELIKLLCHPDPQERLPMHHMGLTNVWKQKWYAGFDYIAMKKQSLKPPFKPVVASPTDRSNFFADPEDKPRDVPYENPRNGWDEYFASC